MRHLPPTADATSQQTDLVDPATIEWALLRLRPPTERDLRLAHRVGMDPNRLLGQFLEQYRAAIAEDSATIDRLTNNDRECGPLHCALWDHVSAFTEERYNDWWIAPVQAVARILGATSEDVDHIASMIRSSRRVGHSLKFTSTRATRGCAAQVAKHNRAREHRRGATRRASSASSTSSADPPPAANPALGVAPAPRAILCFAVLTADEREEAS